MGNLDQRLETIVKCLFHYFDIIGVDNFLVNLIDTSGEGSFNEVLLKRLNEMAARKTWFSFPFAVEVIKSPDYTGYYRLQRVRP